MELLSYVNKMNKITIEELLNNNIAIRVPTKDVLIKVQDKILSIDGTLKGLSSVFRVYDRYEGKLSININKKYNSIKYAHTEWYEDCNYKIIDAEEVMKL